MKSRFTIGAAPPARMLIIRNLAGDPPGGRVIYRTADGREYAVPMTPAEAAMKLNACVGEDDRRRVMEQIAQLARKQ